MSFSILYITVGENLGSNQEGVAKKLLEKIHAIKTQSSKCILLNSIANTEHSEIKLVANNESFIEIEIGVKESDKGYFNKIKSDILFYKKLAGYIRKNGIDYERIIFRYPFASLGLEKFTQEFKKKIVFEHNTKEIEELSLNVNNKKYAYFSLRPSKFSFWFQEKIYPLLQERYNAKNIFNNAHSGSCVTTEIADYEKKRNKNYRTFVSSNFYNVSATELSTSVYNESEKLRLGMIVTSIAAWYGLDRLLRSFATFQKDYILVIAGIDRENYYVQKLLSENNITTNIEFTGKVNKEELISFYNSVHVCFGSLGLYTLRLSYASTLKVKESVAFGIPVVIGYNEEDFVKQREFAPYYLKVNNNNSMIDFNLIRQFALKFYSDISNKIHLHNLALKYLNVDVKVKSLLENIKPT